MKKVLFITAVDLAGSSGSNVATRQTLEALCRLGKVEVTLLSPVPSDGSDLMSELPLSDWEALPQRTRRSAWWHLTTAFRVRHRCRRLLREKEPDVVAVRFQTFFLPAALLFPRPNCRLVLLIRGRMDFGLKEFPLGIVGTLNRHIGLGVASRADRLLFAFRDAVGNLKGRVPSDRIEIVPNAADVTAFPDLTRREARREIEDGGGPHLEGRVVGFAGSLRPRHCLEELFQASARLHRHSHEHQLLVVGDGPMRSKLERLAEILEIEAAVRFTGRVPHERVGRYLAACDLLYGLVDPARPSNPIKVYEALASGRPVVTSRRPELRFVAREGFGILVDGNDPDEVAAALEDGFAMAWSQRDSSRARSYIEEHHSWSRVAEEIVAN